MFKNFIKLFRISHWIKNSFVFVPIIFSKNLSDVENIVSVLLAFITFSLTSSIVYVINDIFDKEKDRLHPKKKNRPIANGSISIRNAIISVIVLLNVVIFLLVQTNYEFGYIIAGYLLLNILYSIKLKSIVILDILSIATGFMLRVLGGSVVINVEVSSWLILSTLFISLFLGVMKRRSEMVLTQDNNSTRKVLEEYSIEFINQISSISAAGVIICYALYTVSERTIAFFGTDNLVFSTIFVIFGIFRYMYLVYKKRQGENTVEILTKDIPLITNIVLYIIFISIIIYF